LLSESFADFFSTRSLRARQITSRKNGLEIELNESLRRRRDALRTQIDSIGDAVASESLRMDDVDTRKREQSSLKRAIADLEKLIAGTHPCLYSSHSFPCRPSYSLLPNSHATLCLPSFCCSPIANDTKKEELLNAVSEATTSLESIQTQQTDDGRVIARSQKVVERYISKRQTLNVRKDECTKLIRDLGVLPEDAFEKYRDTDSAKVSNLALSTLFFFFVNLSIADTSLFASFLAFLSPPPLSLLSLFPSPSS
jgi:structural maintenance of chromosome 3 (chondroitin sulfate proteoglycan 6)